MVTSAALLAAACGDQGIELRTRAGSSPPSAAGQSDPEGDELLLPTTTIVVERAPGRSTEVHPGSWRLISTTDGGRTLHLQVGFGGCTSFHGFEVAESEDVVHVIAVMETAILPPPDEQTEPFLACTTDLRVPIEEVRLDAPLGGRRLLGECTNSGVFCESLGSPPPKRDGDGAPEAGAPEDGAPPRTSRPPPTS